MKKAFFAYLAVVLGGYAFTAYRGWELGSPQRGFIPAGVRQQPGGYRSYGYWRGGK
jgi:hypothetical protein